MSETPLTKEVLEALGFEPGKWKGGMIADHRCWFLDLGQNGPDYTIMEYESHEGGSYGGYDIEAYPGGFGFDTLADLVEDVKRNLAPDEIMTFLIRVNKLP